MSATHHHHDPNELAALHAAGALTPAEAADFERHLAAGDPAYVAAAALYAPVGEALGSLHAAPPPRRSRDALLRLIDSTPQDSPQIWKAWKADHSSDSLYLLRANEGSWDETGVPGVRVRKLFVDKSRNQFTAMVRMEPGTSYPRHRHDGPEECLVLEGDLHVGELVMHKGDFQRAEPDSHHCIQRTEGGCLLLITSSLSDEVF